MVDRGEQDNHTSLGLASWSDHQLQIDIAFVVVDETETAANKLELAEQLLHRWALSKLDAFGLDVRHPAGYKPTENQLRINQLKTNTYRVTERTAWRST